MFRVHAMVKLGTAMAKHSARVTRKTLRCVVTTTTACVGFRES
jgi:hypothetical protein